MTCLNPIWVFIGCDSTVGNVQAGELRGKAEGKYVVIDLNEEGLSYEFYSTKMETDSLLLKLNQVGPKKAEELPEVRDYRAELGERGEPQQTGQPARLLPLARRHVDKAGRCHTEREVPLCNKENSNF